MLPSLKKPRYQIATVLFTVVIGRIWYLHFERHRLLGQLLAKYDDDNNRRLKTSQVISFLKSQNVHVTQEQFHQWASYVDVENDGYDEGELLQIAEIFDDFNGAAPQLEALSLDGWDGGLGISGVFEGFLTLTVLIMGLWSLRNTDKMEAKWAATSFGSAVKMSKMKKSWQTAEAKVQKFEEEEKALTEKIKVVEREISSSDHSRSDKKALEEKLEGLRSEADVLKEKLALADCDLQKMREEASTHMQHAHLSTKRLKDMQQYFRIVCGNFRGASTGKFESKGASSGFSVQGEAAKLAVNAGYSMNTFVFGYPTETTIELFEVDKKRDMLGEGVDCAFRCRSISSGDEFALKIYEIGREAQKRQIISDLHAKQEIGWHLNIVQYHRVIEAEKQIFVMMELIQGVDLFTFVLDKRGLKEELAQNIFLQVCDALKFLHEKKIIHGDIKTENVMISSSQDGKHHAKVIDFGFTCFLNADEQNRSQLRGDMYATPESFQGSEATFSTDIFRTGCMLYVMLVAGLPFRQIGDSGHRSGQVVKSSRFLGLSTDAKDLIQKMTAKDPAERPDINTVIAHPWCKVA